MEASEFHPRSVDDLRVSVDPTAPASAPALALALAADVAEAVEALVDGLLAGQDVLPRTRADLTDARARHRQLQAVTRRAVAAAAPGAPTRVEALAAERLGELTVRCLHLLRRAAQAGADADLPGLAPDVREALVELGAVAAAAHRTAVPASPQRGTLARLVELDRRASRLRARLVAVGAPDGDGRADATDDARADTGDDADADPAVTAGADPGRGARGDDTAGEALTVLARCLDRVTAHAVGIGCEHASLAGGGAPVDRRRTRRRRGGRAPWRVA
ncbi:hypothetical protein [Egicoccus halophilus]|uniref:Uncharacterized protein n=1 Tax=Egicoccus halophilus TaxID=1670830 RepID=A0A8J3A4Y2_9ACTN|nr:hypothetical protein [Egicoccus halophilus]GGI02715.1 hypothetical protein GCM10011354_01300 [Egicoccus halophilus]